MTDAVDGVSNKPTGRMLNLRRAWGAKTNDEWPPMRARPDGGLEWMSWNYVPWLAMREWLRQNPDIFGQPATRPAWDATPVVPTSGVDRVLKLAHARRLAASGEGRRIRLTSGLTLREISEPVGVSATTLLRWETGKSRCRGDAAIRWAELLDALTPA